MNVKVCAMVELWPGPAFCWRCLSRSPNAGPKIVYFDFFVLVFNTHWTCCIFQLFSSVHLYNRVLLEHVPRNVDSSVATAWSVAPTDAGTPARNQVQKRIDLLSITNWKNRVVSSVKWRIQDLHWGLLGSIFLLSEIVSFRQCVMYTLYNIM